MRWFSKEQGGKVMSAIVVLCTAILFAALIFHISDISTAVNTVLSILTPLFIGIVLSLLLMPLEQKLNQFFCWLIARKKPKPKLCKTLAIIVTYVFFLALITAFLCIILPQVITSIGSFTGKIKNFVDNNSDKFREILEKVNIFGFDLSGIVNGWDSILSKVLHYSTLVVSSVVSVSAGIGSGVTQFLLAIVMSVYILAYSERFAAQGKKIACSCMKRERAEELVYWMRRTNRIFAGYITGKIVDSLIIGVLCYLGMLIFRFEYPLMISVIVGVTNILPYFGPIIGGAIGCLILLIVDPLMALWFLLFILVLQQLDGNIIGPSVMGDSIGISAFWILIAILIGGGIWGLTGMLIAIPIFALIYSFLQANIKKKLEKKNMPTETEDYLGNGDLPLPVSEETEESAEKDKKA